MRSTVETASLDREIHLGFTGWTVPAMTTAEQPPAARSPRSLQPARRPADRAPAGWRGWLISGVSVSAVLLGSQTLAASSPVRSDVRLLLPSEGLLAGLGDGLRRGYNLAMEDARRCGAVPPSLQLGWLPPGADPQTPLLAAPSSALLVAPPAAPLAAYGQLAQQLRLQVLLPLQRGQSLEGLPQLRGSDRLWPLLPGRNLEVDRLVQALRQEKIRRVMVVRDRRAESRSLTERFVAGFANAGGVVIGPGSAPMVVAGDDAAALRQLENEADWYRPPALVVIAEPGGQLQEAVRQAQWPPTLMLAWTSPVSGALDVEQIGVHPQSRGPGWAGFAERFQRRWGYEPGVVESAGYDSGLVAALASVKTAGQPGWDLNWLSAKARPQPLCTALKLRAQGGKVRPQAASSAFDLGPGQPPSASLQLSRG